MSKMPRTAEAFLVAGFLISKEADSIGILYF